MGRVHLPEPLPGGGIGARAHPRGPARRGARAAATVPARRAARRAPDRYEVEANWKVILENYNECYHCGPVHPELCRLVPAFKQRGGSELDWERGIPHREGAWTFTLSGTTDRAPVPGLDEDERVRHKGELVYPNFMLSLAAEHAAAFTVWPQAPDRTMIVNEFLFHPDEMAKPGFDPADAVEFWDIVNRQDWAICASVQRGMRSRVFQSGYYAPMESASLDIRRYVRNARVARAGRLHAAIRRDAPDAAGAGGASDKQRDRDRDRSPPALQCLIGRDAGREVH